MRKRILCAVLALALAAACAPALAQTPKPIVPLDYADVPAPYEGQYHYLLISYDEFTNTDGIVLITFDVRAKRFLCTTFSREFLVERPDGRGPGRITYIVRDNDVDALCKVISTHFGVKVEKYVLMDYDMVDEIIDRIGGVTLTITANEAHYLTANYLIPAYYTEPAVNGAGTYLFYGRAAVLYMRMRKGVGGDDGRTGRIRKVVSSLADKYQAATLSEAQDLLVNAILPNIRDTNLTLDDLMSAIGQAMLLRGVTPESLQMPSSESMTDIIYGTSQTREVDFDLCRQQMDDFLSSTYVVVDEE